MRSELEALETLWFLYITSQGRSQGHQRWGSLLRSDLAKMKLEWSFLFPDTMSLEMF